MKLREVMTHPVIRIHPEEPVAVAARTMAQYNIGAMPVCGSNGRVCGMITDRDIVTRCLAAGRSPAGTIVGDVMTANITAVSPDMNIEEAVALMGEKQVRRLPVMENGRLCGMVSLGDLSIKGESTLKAGNALYEISSNLSRRG